MWWGRECEEIFSSENRILYSDAIQEQCDIMSGMERCEQYFGREDLVSSWNTTATDNPEDEIVLLSWSLTRDKFSDAQKLNVHLCLMGSGKGCEQIFDDERREIYADVIQEQCDIMKGMEMCNTYFDEDIDVVDNPVDMTIRQWALEATQPEVVELQDGDSYTITIQESMKTINGKQFRMLAYNGSIPWPIIKAPQWSSVQLTVINEIDDIKTNLHHHGLRHDNSQDGVPKDMWWYDTPIMQWERITYTLSFPDVGVYRYHPHVREDLQQELWLYGNYIVESDLADYRNQVNSEHVLMLDDLFVDDQWLVPFDREKWTWVVMGRFGNVPLVNGKEEYTLDLKEWETTRLFLTNVANVTPFNLTVSWLEMKVVWWDIGKYERDERITNLVIAPAERYVIELYAVNAWTYTIMNAIDGASYEMGKITVSDEKENENYGESFYTMRENTEIQEDIDQYRQYFAKPFDKKLVLSVEMDGMEWMMDGDGHWDHWEHSDNTLDTLSLPGWMSIDKSTIERKDEMATMNAWSTTENTRWMLIDDTTGKSWMDIDREFVQGDVVKIRIFNDPDSVHPMQHPIHFHGQRFLVIDKNGVENTNLVWKDTVLVPTGEYVDIMLDTSNPGKRMTHCHIAEHLTAWMMMNFTVMEK